MVARDTVNIEVLVRFQVLELKEKLWEIIGGTQKGKI